MLFFFVSFKKKPQTDDKSSAIRDDFFLLFLEKKESSAFGVLFWGGAPRWRRALRPVWRASSFARTRPNGASSTKSFCARQRPLVALCSRVSKGGRREYRTDGPACQFLCGPLGICEKKRHDTGNGLWYERKKGKKRGDAATNVKGKQRGHEQWGKKRVATDDVGWAISLLRRQQQQKKNRAPAHCGAPLCCGETRGLGWSVRTILTFLFISFFLVPFFLFCAGRRGLTTGETETDRQTETPRVDQRLA